MGDGFITKKELLKGVKKKGMNPQDLSLPGIEALLGKTLDGKGMDFKEFKPVWRKLVEIDGGSTDDKGIGKNGKDAGADGGAGEDDPTRMSPAAKIDRDALHAAMVSKHLHGKTTPVGGK